MLTRMVSDPRCRTFSPRVLRSLCFNPCRACAHRRATSATMSAPDPRLARHGSVPQLRSPAAGLPSGGPAGAAGPGPVSAPGAAPLSSRTHLQHVPLQHLFYQSPLTCPRLRLGAATEADVEADTEAARATGDVVQLTKGISFQEERPQPTATADAAVGAPIAQTTNGVPPLQQSRDSSETLTNVDSNATVATGGTTTGTTTEATSEEENERSLSKTEESANKEFSRI